MNGLKGHSLKSGYSLGISQEQIYTTSAHLGGRGTQKVSRIDGAILKSDDTQISDPDRSNTGLQLQPWASDEHSLDAEASRFLKYITVPQKECKASKLVGCPMSGCPTNWPLNICFNEIAKRQKCIVYSFRTSFPTLDFENEMADAGCEVHVFDPTQRSMRYEPLAQRPADDVQRNLVFHRITLDWRETVSEFEIFGPPSLRAKNLRTVMAELGHHKVEVLRADLESSEWKLIENLLQDRWINRINQLILNVHLHWSGFEVSGAKPDVVRFWYSVIFGLGSSDFHLFNSVAHLNAPQIFLGETGKFNASSSYTLAFMRNL
ncbi:putative methyltransferase-like protein 24-like [Apostichopus japonicus]|uniref:Putative methyltransferase-like protein 24-like n=1 Tax=Stichopus japonicus TaxID=307972 RepID=A0A2G8LDT7_STIJA|nr:putative methyltransferase-like protein 24-like [Apostichopus japonicus]